MAVALGACLILKRQGLQVVSKLCALSFLFLLLSMDYVSDISVWAVPHLNFLQFPWRFLSGFQLFVAAAFVGAMSTVFPHSNLLRSTLIAGGCVLMSIYYSIGVPAQSFVPSTVNLLSLRQSLITLDQEHKYLPVSSKLPTTCAPPELLSVEDKESMVVLIAKTLNDYTYRVSTQERCKAVWHQYWFDRWTVEIDGLKTKLSPFGELGICTFDLDAGEHVVRIHFGKPLRVKIVELLSLSVLLVATVVIIVTARRSGTGHAI